MADIQYGEMSHLKAEVLKREAAPEAHGQQA
jgi:hypothetical protein